ncbi:hypothetical protein DY000_02063138 [Brassica cretica]|uniref:RING-type E3 ubiquitin transferase n=1 Tax=Brassica cretica TaxID=69181 RepID=A0ABQ7AS72_BRACR|nr:hypothetical protein DY000_02063138 [Brassica cretica]
MPPPPRNPDHRSPKRPRFPPPPPVPEEEEEDEFSDVSADDEEDCSDESADDEEDDVEVVAVVTVAEAQSRRYVGSSSSSSSPVKLNTSEILDCPTCLEPLRGPIYQVYSLIVLSLITLVFIGLQCVNGHITCSPCLPRVYKQCPVCRIPIGNIRCRAMEMVIESSAVPCRYAIYGCKETTLYGDQAHEKVCPYIRCQCPVKNCSYTGGYKEVEAHARLQHSWDVEHLIPFVFNTPQIFSINLARTSRAVFQEEKEGDMIVVQTFKRTNGGVSVTVSHIAPLSLGLRNLSCSLAKLNAYTTLRLGVMVKKIQKLREQEEPREDFLFIPDYMLSDNHLKMQICVGSEFNVKQCRFNMWVGVGGNRAKQCSMQKRQTLLRREVGMLNQEFEPRLDLEFVYKWVKLGLAQLLMCSLPIYQCVNGHITCSPCLPRVYKQCPVCRIPIGNIRCRAMEMVIESSAVPCRYAIYGCKETTLYGDQAHEKVCPYIRCQCPVTNCSYTGDYKEVEAHARLQHSWDVEHLIPFVFNTPQIFSINLARTSRAVFQEEKEGDMIVVQTFKRTNGGVCVTVSHIAPLSLGVRNLSCSLAKLNAYTTLRLGVMVKKIQKLREQEEPREDFLFIPDYMLSDNHLKMQICVGSEFKYVHI